MYCCGYRFPICSSVPLAGVQVIYRLASHFFPDLVLSQIKNAPATIMPAVNIAANISILCYFKIKFPILAKIMVSVIPATNIYQFIPTSILVYSGVTPPNTNATKVSWERLKKYPASLSRLVLSFSFRSLFASCCSLQFPIL